MQKMNSQMYARVLENWLPAAAKYFYSPGENPEIMCYGTGESHHWAVQTNMNVFAALAVLAMSPDLDETAIGMSREALQDIALKLLRYSLRTHHTGRLFCSNRKQWGHSWISALALERMMPGFEAVQEILPETDKLGMRKILESESDNLLDNYSITAGISDRDNNPESNIWNGAILLRTAFCYPDTLRREEYLEKATGFFVNGISIPSDRESERIVNGKPVKAWHIGPNFTPNFSLNHHDYMNIGYMAICLSNIAILHFSFKQRGLEVPEEVYFHAEELWETLKKFTFPDGRLLRIGGDNRIRYCYCQDYAVPTWLFAFDRYGDRDALQFESEWFKLVDREAALNPDGGFLSGRLRNIARSSPFYYTRLEGDRAVSMAYGAYWRYSGMMALPDELTPPSPAPEFEWQDEFHGAAMVRDSGRIASWVWMSAQCPNGVFGSPDKSDMAEWQHNLSGELVTSGLPTTKVQFHEQQNFTGGFVSSGYVTWTESKTLGEAEQGDVFAWHGIVFAALPDHATAICLQYAETSRRIYLHRRQGLGLKMPNDIFNHCSREYFSAAGKSVLNGRPDKEEIISLESPWLNIDNSLAVFNVYGDEYFSIYRPEKPQIKVSDFPHTSLYADEICTQFETMYTMAPPGKTVIDTGAVLMTGIEAAATRKQQAHFRPIPVAPGIRALSAVGADKRKYLLIANFSRKAAKLPVQAFAAERYVSLNHPEKTEKELRLEPFTAALLTSEAR
ncbi:MAG: hypothetical protein PHV59_07645 [Victivallales bacterium]|nr:hypothetical protein [Victivallales bacterium]